MTKEEFNYDVFVSHAGEDTAWTEKLAERLRHEGLRVWFDKWEIKPGDHLLVRLNEGLASSAKMVTVWSTNYFRDGKTWTLAEVFSQLHQDPLGKTGSLIPVLFEDCKIPPTCLNQVYVDFRRKDYFESAFAQLIESLPPRTYASWEEGSGRTVKGVVEQLKDGTARLRLSSREIILQTSEALQKFKVVRGSETIYFGKAVVTDVIPRESEVLCLVSLDPINTSQFLQAVCRTRQGMELRATNVRISDDRVIVEFPVLKSTLRISDILSDFHIFVGDEKLYAGDATIQNLLETGTETLCELVLDSEKQQTLSELSPSRVESEVNNLVHVHGKQFLLKPRFRSTVDDLAR